MDALIHSLLSFVLLYKYAAIFIIMFLGALALPIPSSTILLASFVFGSQGYMNPWLVAAAGVGGYTAGDASGYLLAKRFGKEVLHTIGFGRLFEAKWFVHLEKMIAAYPRASIFWSRFITTISPAGNVLAAFAGISFWTFIAFDLAGQICEVALFYVGGTLFADQWAQLGNVLSRFGIFLSIACVLGVLLVWHGRRKRRDG